MLDDEEGLVSRRRGLLLRCGPRTIQLTRKKVAALFFGVFLLIGSVLTVALRHEISSLKKSTIAPSSIEVQDGGDRLTVSVEGLVDGTSSWVGVKLQKVECTIHTSLDPPSTPHLAALHVASSEPLGFGASKRSDSSSFSMSLDDFDFVVTRRVLALLGQTFTHAKMSAGVYSKIPESLRPSGPPPLEMELKCWTDLDVTTAFTPFSSIFTMRYFMNNKVVMDYDRILSYLPSVLEGDHSGESDASLADSMREVLKFMRKPSFSIDVPVSPLPPTLKKLKVNVPSTKFEVALPGPSSWLLEVSEIDVDLTKVSHCPVAFKAEEKLGHVVDISSGVSQSISSGSRVAVAAESTSESFLAYLLGKQHSLTYVQSGADEGGEQQQPQHVELDFDAISQVSCDFDRDAHSVDLQYGSSKMRASASIAPPAERKLMKNIDEVAEYVADHNDFDSVKHFIERTFNLDFDEIWNEGSPSLDLIKLDVSFFNMWEAMGGDEEVGKAFDMEVATTYSRATEEFTLNVIDTDGNGVDVEFVYYDNVWLYGTAFILDGGRTLADISYEVSNMDSNKWNAPLLDIEFTMGNKDLLDLPAGSKYDGESHYNYMLHFEVASDFEGSVDQNVTSYDFTEAFSTVTGGDDDIVEGWYLVGSGNVTDSLIHGGEKVTNINGIINAVAESAIKPKHDEHGGEDGEGEGDGKGDRARARTLSETEETLITLKLKTGKSGDEFNLKINPFDIRSKDFDGDNDYHFHHVHTLLFKDGGSDGFYFETNADIDENGEQLIDATVRLQYDSFPNHDSIVIFVFEKPDEKGEYVVAETWLDLSFTWYQYVWDGYIWDYPSWGQMGVNCSLAAVDEQLFGIDTSFGWTNTDEAWGGYLQNNGLRVGSDRIEDIDGMVVNGGGGGELFLGQPLLPFYFAEYLGENLPMFHATFGPSTRIGGHWNGTALFNFNGDYRVIGNDMKEWGRLTDQQTTVQVDNPFYLAGVQFRGWERLASNIDSIYALTLSGKLVKVFANNKNEYRAPLPFPTLDLELLQEKVSQVTLVWGSPSPSRSGFGAKEDVTAVEYRLMGFDPDMEIPQKEEDHKGDHEGDHEDHHGERGLEGDWKDHEDHEDHHEDHHKDHEDHEEKASGPSIIGAKLSIWQEEYIEIPKTFLKMSQLIRVNISDRGFFEENGDGLWGSKDFVKVFTRIPVFVDVGGKDDGLGAQSMTMHSIIDVGIRDEDKEEEKDDHHDNHHDHHDRRHLSSQSSYDHISLRMKATSISTVEDKDSDSYCEKTELQVWEDKSEGGANRMSLPQDKDDVTSIRMEGCQETFGNQEVFIDGEREGEIVVLDDSLLPGVLQAVDVPSNMRQTMDLMMTKEKLEDANDAGKIPDKTCHKSGCFNGQSCDAILNQLARSADSTATCSSLELDGCDCTNCMCHEMTGESCEAVGDACEGGLVCKSWPSGRLFVGSTKVSRRRKLFGKLVGNSLICVPHDW